MANHASAIKRIRQNTKRKVRNAGQRNQMRGQVRKLQDMIKAKDEEGSRKELLAAISQVMHARSKNVIHKNTAARKVSRLTRLVNRTFASK